MLSHRRCVFDLSVVVVALSPIVWSFSRLSIVLASSPLLLRACVRVYSRCTEQMQSAGLLLTICSVHVPYTVFARLFASFIGCSSMNLLVPFGVFIVACFQNIPKFHGISSYDFCSIRFSMYVLMHSAFRHTRQRGFVPTWFLLPCGFMLFSTQHMLIPLNFIWFYSIFMRFYLTFTYDFGIKMSIFLF